MPVFYNFTENGLVYSFDDIFVPADLFREGTLWIWGNNAQARMGGNFNIPTALSTPITTFAGGTNWKQVSCGNQSSYGIKTDGTLWSWGGNVYGQLGNNSGLTRSTPVTTFAGGTDWKQVVSSSFHVVAIKTDGTLWTWGRNTGGAGGQLGTNDTTDRLTPVTTFAGGTNWKALAPSLSGFFSAAIKSDGTLWVCGDNGYGQLGTNDTTNRLTPVTTFAGGTNWKKVTTGYRTTIAIKTDGTLWAWGDNLSGTLGINSTAYTSTPVTTFVGGTNWKQVSCKLRSVLSVKTDGTLWAWGSNNNFQSGTNDTTNRLTPVTTFAGGTNWKQAAAGNDMSAAIKTDGTLWTWGLGTFGRLGINSGTNRSTPVTIFSGQTNWKQVSCGAAHMMAVTYEDPVI